MSDAMNDATKRKEPEADAPKIAVAVKSADEPDAKKAKTSPADMGTVRKQVEYYLSDDNLKHDKFFHDKITGDKDGWLAIDMVLACNKMKALRVTVADVVASLKDSKIEVKEDGLSIRRPANVALPTLEAKQQHQKKSAAHAHDGGVIAVVNNIPAEQSWMQIKETLRGKLPEKVALWFVSEVNDKSSCVVATAPFDNDLQFFEDLEIDVGGTKLKLEVAQGDVLQQALKVMPKHIRDKREKEVRKRQKERNRPIVVGAQRFVNPAALRGRVKEILNSRSDGETLKPDGSDFKLIKALLSFHPKGEQKSQDMVGIKVAKSSQGDSRCFWMVKANGDAEDFSAQKCLGAIEANPPYVEIEKKETSSASSASQGLHMERTFLFSSESVNEGHPDKLCDQVSDAVLDTCLTADPLSKVACETATKDNMVMVAGEITTKAKIDYEQVVRGVVAKIGFDSFVDDLSSVDSKGLSDKTCEVIVRINKQSPDIAGGVHVGKDEMDVGAGDQGIMFGYASDETADCMPLTHSMATRLGKKLTDVRKNGKLWWLRPDGKTQVTIEYMQKADGAVEPLKIHTVVISTQHAEPLKAVRTKECAGYTGPEMTAPSMEEMNKLIVEEVIKETLKEIKLKSGQPALTLFGDHTHLHINPSGKFIIGGPQGDAGLTGRKIIIDTYGGWGAHGGGAFSGKDPTKVDRSAAYICRQMAKSLVKSGLSKRALVQLSYAIGVAKPLSLFVETYGTEQGDLTPVDIENVIKIAFDCRPGAIAVSLALREPKYQETAAYCHFGREAVTRDGKKFFEWENAKDLSKYKSMNSAQVAAELKASNYLTKWVD